MKLSTKASSATHRVLLYGAPKTGKTELAGELSKHYKLLWFDAEQGFTTLLKLPKIQQDNIELVSVPDSRAFPIAVETWLKVISGKSCTICELHGKVSCPVCVKSGAPSTTVCLDTLDDGWVVVFDSLTQFTNSAISNMTKNRPEDAKLERDDWGNLSIIVDRFLSQVQAARYNIVCITHEQEVDMEDGKSKIVPVSGSSKSSRNTAKYFDHVIYCEVKNKKHSFGSSTGFSMQAISGSRSDVVMEKSTAPTLLDVFTSWKTRSTQDGKSRVLQLPDVVNGTSTEQTSVSRSDTGSTAVSNNVQSTELQTTGLNNNGATPSNPGAIALSNLAALRAKIAAGK